MSTNKSRKSAAPAAKAQRRSRQKATTPAAAKLNLKAATIIALLRRDGGATLDEMTHATGWQKHSVRGFMAGALKKKHGLTVASEKTEKGRSYGVVGEVQS
jgi:hypothetical protein